MHTLVKACWIATVLLPAAGCAVKYTQPTTQPAALTPQQKSFEVVWDSCRDVLRDYRFELDRQDRRAGVMTTLPLTGMHFFELWRKDAARGMEFGESTLQTIYRTARVAIRPSAPGAATYEVQVQVLLQRSDRAAPQVTSTSEAYSLFAAGGESRRRNALVARDGQPTGSELVDLGHDRALEAKITADIAKAAGPALAGERRPPATQPK